MELASVFHKMDKPNNPVSSYLASKNAGYNIKLDIGLLLAAKI